MICLWSYLHFTRKEEGKNIFSTILHNLWLIKEFCYIWVVNPLSTEIRVSLIIDFSPPGSGHDEPEKLKWQFVPKSKYFLYRREKASVGQEMWLAWLSSLQVQTLDCLLPLQVPGCQDRKQHCPWLLSNTCLAGELFFMKKFKKSACSLKEI